MLKNIVEHYIENLANTIILDAIESNKGTVKLYENLGFVREGELYKGFGAPEQTKCIFNENRKKRRCLINEHLLLFVGFFFFTRS